LEEIAWTISWQLAW